MITASIISNDPPDPAAIFGAALSLWNACRKREGRPDGLNLSEAYDGMDGLMRVVMKVAGMFEEWACKHIDFDQNMDVWPYLLEDKFGEACLSEMFADSLNHFNEEDCLRVALNLRLPIKHSTGLPVPIDVTVENTIPHSAFRKFRIQTVRCSGDLESVVPFVIGDDPYDEQFGVPFFGVYGVDKDGILEQIADRDTYGDAVALVQKLVPDAVLPAHP